MSVYCRQQKPNQDILRDGDYRGRGGRKFFDLRLNIL